MEAQGLSGNDPLAGVANLFDLGLVFMVGLIIMLLSALGARDLLDPKSRLTILKESSRGEMELITKKGRKIKAMKVTRKEARGRGTRLGTAYRLEDGSMVYVPDRPAGRGEGR